MSKGRLWTTEETEYLMQHYKPDSETIDRLAEHFNRDRQAVKVKVSSERRRLGISARRPKDYNNICPNCGHPVRNNKVITYGDNHGLLSSYYCLECDVEFSRGKILKPILDDIKEAKI